MNQKILRGLTCALLLSSFAACAPDSGNPSKELGKEAAPPATKRLTTRELLYDRKDVPIESLILDDVASRPSGTPSGAESDQDGDHLGEEVAAIAIALKNYVAQHQKFPARIEDLYPDFIKDEGAFWIHYLAHKVTHKTRLVLLTPSSYEDPENKGLFLIAFTIDPIPFGINGDTNGRMIIDSNYSTYFMGESRFFELLCGKDLFDAAHQPPILPAGEAGSATNQSGP